MPLGEAVVWLAASERAHESNGLFDREARRTHWLPFTREPETARRKLWELCLRDGGLA